MPIKINWCYSSVRILRYILNYQDRNGFPPTLFEIQNKLRYKSHSTATYHIKRMQAAGLLARDYKRARSIRIVDVDRALFIVNKYRLETDRESS